MNGPSKNCGCRHMANTKNHHRSTKSPWILQLLLPFYQGLHIYRKTTPQTHMKRSRMAMGYRRTRGLRSTKETSNNGTHTGTHQVGQPVRIRSGRIWLCGRCSTSTEEGGR